MKPKQTNGSRDSQGQVKGFGKACVASCQRILTQISAAKETIFAESRSALKSQERVLRLALNEAEAVAWQTAYPHLVFPDLAMEKVQAVIAWDAHQQALRRTTQPFVLAA
jgi:DNA-binding FrmR family transcriptional regulator